MQGLHLELFYFCVQKRITRQSFLLNYFAGFKARGFHHLQVFQCFHADVGESGLFTAGKFPGAAKFQVVFGEFKPAFGFRESL